MWQNTLNVINKNPRAQTSKSSSTKIKYVYKRVKSKAQTSAYNQPIYLSTPNFVWLNKKIINKIYK